MKNNEIIFAARMDLMKEGKIGRTNNKITLEHEDGTREEVWEPAPIHTYDVWQQLGYQVKKGEHAKAKLKIWLPAKKTKADLELEEKTGKPINQKMIMKTAFFFSPSQVQRKEAENAPA